MNTNVIAQWFDVFMNSVYALDFSNQLLLILLGAGAVVLAITKLIESIRK